MLINNIVFIGFIQLVWTIHSEKNGKSKGYSNVSRSPQDIKIIWG